VGKPLGERGGKGNLERGNILRLGFSSAKSREVWKNFIRVERGETLGKKKIGRRGRWGGKGEGVWDLF